MKNRIVMCVRGGEVKTLYTERINLHAFGTLHVERASNVEFDNDAGGWVVTFPDGSSLPGMFKSRDDALAAEVRHLQAKLGGS